MENRINWHYTRRSEWKRLAVPCGRAGSAATLSRPLWTCGKRIYTQQDVDVVACARIFKIKPRFPFNVKIGLYLVFFSALISVSIFLWFLQPFGPQNGSQKS